MPGNSSKDHLTLLTVEVVGEHMIPAAISATGASSAKGLWLRYNIPKQQANESLVCDTYPPATRVAVLPLRQADTSRATLGFSATFRIFIQS